LITERSCFLAENQRLPKREISFMFRGNLGTIGLMTFCFVVFVLFVQTFKQYTPFGAVAEILREKPDHFGWGTTFLANKEYAKAVGEYREAIQLDPNDARAHERLAWVLATAPKEGVRNGKESMEHATQACELTTWSNPEYLATLSAACAETGDFEQAMKWQKKALEFPQLDEKMADEYRQRLKVYQQSKPLRDKP
jgi:tetratricopeptide (TPR) repeat protein